MLRYLFCGLLVSATLLARAQENYVITSYNLTDSSNTGFLPEDQKSLPEILIDGFLAGKLKGYAYAVKETPVYGEEPTWPLPPKWQPGKDYYPDDTVTYQGRFYRMVGDVTVNSPQDDNFSWTSYDRKQILYFNYEWPPESDTLTPAAFNAIRSFEQQTMGDEWNREEMYELSYEVIYNGKIYQANQENIKGVVPGETDAWLPMGDRILLIDARGFDVFSVLNHYDRNGQATPQFIELSIGEEVYWGRKIFFNYQEAFDYLKSIREPVHVNRYTDSPWWGGTLFNAYPESQNALGSQLLRLISEKKINLSKIKKLDTAITRQALYSDQDAMALPQIKGGKVASLNLISRSGNYEIPLKVFLNAMKGNQSVKRPTRYSEALAKGVLLNGRRDTLPYTRITPLKNNLTSTSCDRIKSRQAFLLQGLTKPDALSEFIFEGVKENRMNMYRYDDLTEEVNADEWKQMMNGEGDETLSLNDFNYFRLVYDVTASFPDAQTDYRLVAVGLHAMNSWNEIYRGALVSIDELLGKIKSSSKTEAEKKNLLLLLNELQNGKLPMIRQQSVSGLICTD